MYDDRRKYSRFRAGESTLNKIFTGALLTGVLAVTLSAAAQAADTTPFLNEQNPIGGTNQASSETDSANLVRLEGAVVDAAAGELQLQSGVTVYITNGTVIKPDGADVLGARHVIVTGHPSSQDPSGSIDATEVDIE
jgi:hypothetical protein